MTRLLLQLLLIASVLGLTSCDTVVLPGGDTPVDPGTGQEVLYRIGGVVVPTTYLPDNLFGGKHVYLLWHTSKTSVVVYGSAPIDMASGAWQLDIRDLPPVERLMMDDAGERRMAVVSLVVMDDASGRIPDGSAYEAATQFLMPPVTAMSVFTTLVYDTDIISTDPDLARIQAVAPKGYSVLDIEESITASGSTYRITTHDPMAIELGFGELVLPTE